MSSSRATLIERETEIISHCSTIVDLVRWRAQCQGQKTAYVYVSDSGTEKFQLNYSELDEQAQAVAGLLQSVVSPGERVLLLYPPGLDYLTAFYGCLYAGVIAVPAYPPRGNRNLERLQLLIADAAPALVLTTPQILSRVTGFVDKYSDLQKLRWLTSEKLASTNNNWKMPPLTSNDVAFLQYTSGSTSAPRGVMLSHGNLLSNDRLMRRAFQQTQQSVIVGWLPLYHDMGLIGNVLHSLSVGSTCVLMSPTAFLQQPFLWLKAISEYRATTSGGPNFAYELCVRKISDEQRASLDLSSWTVAFNGAEPVRAETIERFAEIFAPVGFQHEAFRPCYGLAEATLLVSAGTQSNAPKNDPTIRMVTKRSLGCKAIVEFTNSESESRKLVGCGQTQSEGEVIIANPESLTRCTPGEVGEIWVSGPSVATGYWNKPEETARTFRAVLKGDAEKIFLRTGDLGFLWDGELFVTGRLKDLIIIRGRNHYPQDIEQSVERSHPSLRPGCGAAFSITVEDEERLVVAVEIEPRHKVDPKSVIVSIREAISVEHEVQAEAVVLLKAGTIPKTSSGKIRRQECRRLFSKHDLEVVAEWRASSDVHIEPVELSAISSPDRDTVENWLRSQFTVLLKRDEVQIDLHQPIMQYGLDSLLATEFTHRIETGLGVAVPLTTILENPTIAQLASVIQAELKNPAAAKQSASSSTETLSEYPLSFGQRSLWFIHRMDPESAAYNLATALRVLGALDPTALQAAFNALVHRHDSLRTTFTQNGDKPVQLVHDHLPFSINFVDASSWSESTLHEYLAEQAQLPFHLQEGPLLRVMLLKRFAEEHVLLFVVHHIIVDFWSLALLMEELRVLYEAERRHMPASLPRSSAKYTDHVRREALALDGPRGMELSSYWREQLSAVNPTLNLPTDRPRPAVQTYSGASHAFQVGTDLTFKLKELARNSGTTLYTVLLAAFQTLLYRYTEEEEFIIGSPAAGRTSAEFANVVGYFVNPLPLRADLSGNPSFVELLRRVRATVIGAFTHQDFPFALLVEQLQPTRDPSRTPLFQHMFVMQQSHLLRAEGLSALALGETGMQMQFGELQLESIALQRRVAPFDLTLAMAESGANLAGSLEYNTDLFDAEMIAGMIRHFQVLLGGVVAQPDRPLLQHSLLTERERQQLLVEWNDTNVDYSCDVSLHELFERQAVRRPEAVALILGHEQVTYRELNQRANRLAHHLRKLGAGPESLVGVLLDRSAWLVTALLGVLKSGAAYVPLDPAYPSERVRFMLEDAGVRVLLTQQSLLNDLPRHDARVVCLDTEWENIAAESGENPECCTGSSNLAYVIYTSGSTGRPKGVAIEHRSVVTLIQWARDFFTEAQLTGVLASTSVCFDLSIFEIFVPLSSGLKVILAANALELATLEAAEEVTLINTVPSAMAELIRMESVPESVRVVNLAGEPLQKALVERIYELKSVQQVVNLYGPSEDTTYSTRGLIEKGDSRVPTIGRPIANTQIYLLDAQQEPVPVGVTAELYISGDGLARGYLNRPVTTAEKFLPDPFGTRPGARMYRTGDLARYLPDGRIEFLGRLDHQVKLRGFRIELGEVEATLRKHRAVRECVAITGEVAPGDVGLIAYVVYESGRTATTEELRRHLKESLPDYMIPACFVTLPEMPLSPNGKIDRRALPPPPQLRPGFDKEFVAPRNQIEETVAQIWANVLGLERVGIHDNFFELGGHSLLATQIVARINQSFKIDFPLRQMFVAPTVAELAVRLAAALTDGVARQLTAIERGPRVGSLPLSFTQQRLWFLQQLEPESAAYNMPVLLRIAGRLDVSALERSVQEILRRHEVLRTTIQNMSGTPVQVVGPAETWRFKVLDLAGVGDEDQRFTRALGSATIEAHRPFDLARGPMIRGFVWRLGEEDHLLLLTIHHIVSDGWSLGIFGAELSTLYKSFIEGKASPLPELSIQYSDFALWQHEHLLRETAHQMEYWKRQLRGTLPVLELPSTESSPAAQDIRVATAPWKLPQSLTEELKAFSRERGVTLFMALLTAFKILLHRYTGLEDILVGTPVAGRSRVETESLIGMFVQTLVLRSDLSGNPTVEELLQKVRETTLEAHANQDVPFEMLVDELQSERDLSRTPLFQVQMVLLNAPQAELELPGLEVTQIDLGGAAPKFDLILFLSEKNGELVGSWEYNTERVGSETVKRMARHFSTLLENVVADPKQKLSGLGLLSEAERQQLHEWNETEREYGRERSIAAVFEEQVQERPEAVAVVMGEQSLTYEELNRRANQVGQYLQELAVGPEVCVGLCVERSLEMVIGMLGILKAGGAYVSLDASYPTERLAYMLADAGVAVVLTQESLLDLLPSHWGEVVSLDGDWEEIAQRSDENPESGAEGENLAHVMYTSGSTGEPKGVAILQRGVVRLVKETDYAEFGPAETFVQMAPLTFDASTFEIWGSLLNSGRLVLLQPGAPALEELGAALRRYEVSTLWLTAGLFHLLVDERPEELRGLRQLLAGGDVLSAGHVKKALQWLERGCVINGYGPTENTTFSCCQRLDHDNEIGAAVPIGRPIANTQAYVLNGQLQQVPVGVVGELYLGGDGLARGYQQRVDLTAEKFIPHPYSARGGERLYRTGDLVRYLEDGRLEFVGRVDNQVKVRGYRIEPGEIETVLARHGGVRDVVVVAHSGTSGDKRLVAYIVGQPEIDLEVDELRSYLKEHLPAYMMPSVFMLLDRLPLTHNGKVDRTALPDPDVFQPELTDAFVAPRTNTEEQLASIWARVLDIERVGVNDNFFELGGHSLLATQAISRIREVFDVELPLRALFDSPTVAGLAHCIEAALKDDQRSSASEIGKVAHQDTFPLSFAQQRLWFLNQLEPGNPFYNISTAVTVRGDLNCDALAQALTQVVRRHDALRTTFVVDGNEPVQVVGDEARLEFVIEDLRQTDDAEACAREIARIQAELPFDLTVGPLLRVRLLRLSALDYVVLVTMHHIVGDGWSMGVLVHEVADLYGSIVTGHPGSLKEVAIQYPDFAVWQREQLQGDVLKSQLDYWKNQLANAPAVLELPTDRPRPVVQTYRGASERFTLDLKVLEELKILSRQQGATLFMTLLAIFNILLHRYTRQRDILVGSPIANRNRAEIEGLIGFFVNTLVLRTRIRPHDTFAELLRQVRETTLGAFEHQDVPFEKLVEELGTERDLSHAPLFQVMFVLQNAPRKTLSLPGVTLNVLEGENRTSKFDLMLTMAEDEHGLRGQFEYNTDLFDAESIRRMVQHFQTLVQSVVAESLQPVGSLRLMAEIEEQQVVPEWNNTAAVYAQAGKCLHEIIEAQVKKTPDRIALVSGDASWSYAELNRRANQLAHYLRRLGVGPESRVGLCMERSLDLLVGLLAILKAGGAYVPLDREYPLERLRFMIDDAQLRLVLTNDPALAAFADEAGVQLIDLNAEAEQISRESRTEPESGVRADNLAYVIYTSGSTGVPKGVAITHRNVSAFLHWAIEFFSAARLQAVLASTSINFDLSIFELFAPLSVGGRVILAENALQLPALAAASQVELVNTVPSAMAELIRQNAVPSSVRVVNLAGEPLPRKLVQEIYALGTVEQVINLYGPSEDTTYSTYEVVADAADEAVLIGRPISNSQIYLLDEEMHLVAMGVPGELYIAGAGLARGYLGRAELTAERFVPNPFARAAGERLYRTGDLARYRGDGRIEYLGRLDQQVKIRGFRIELGEIEAQLGRHPLVQECVVTANEAEVGGKRLVAYVVGAETITTSVLRRYLKEKLPGYMVPAAFVFLSELPLLPNGKIDRRALPAPQTAEPADGHVGPRNPVEELIAGVWADVLGIKAVSINSDFFTAGGHSLLATQVIARLRQIFHVDIPLRSMFEKPTIAGLSDIVSAAMNDGLAQDIDPITRASRESVLPLSFAQERLWFWEHLHPGTSTYNIASAFRLDGDLDVSILEQSLNEILRRHEILRTSYVAVEGHPVQIIASHTFVPLSVTDVSHLPESERDLEVRRLAEEETLRPFDLTKAPLLRVSLLRLGAREHVALVSMHHIVSDGWSIGVLVEEVATLYQEFLSGNPSPLPELSVQYADFAKWQREWLHGDVLTEQLAYWKEQLRDAPLLRLRTDRPRPQVYSSKGSIVPVTLPAELLHELKSLSRQNNVTLFMTLLAAFNVLLHRHTGQDDLVVGTDIANRTRVETEKLIGFFVNMLVLRTNLQGDPSFTELLRRVREVTLGAYTHQDIPFTKLVDEFQIRRDLTRNPLFQVVFVLQNAPVKNLELTGLTLTPVEFDVKSAPFDLVFALTETAEGLRGAVTYSTELFDRETVQQLIRHYQNVLEGVVANPDQGLSSLAILQDHEIDSHAVSDFEVKLSRKDLEDVLFELSQASHSQ